MDFAPLLSEIQEPFRAVSLSKVPCEWAVADGDHEYAFLKAGAIAGIKNYGNHVEIPLQLDNKEPSSVPCKFKVEQKGKACLT